MTLGEIIKEYTDEHSVSQFIKDSGLSKAYVYMLINNKNNKGEAIVPSIETIKKVANGIHTDFDEVFNRLDYDFVVKVDNDTIPNAIKRRYTATQLDKDYFAFTYNDSVPASLHIENETESISNVEQEYFYALNNLISAAKECKTSDIKLATDFLERLKKNNM